MRRFCDLNHHPFGEVRGHVIRLAKRRIKGDVALPRLSLIAMENLDPPEVDNAELELWIARANMDIKIHPDSLKKI